MSFYFIQSFIEFEGPLYTYNQLRNGDKIFRSKKFRSEFDQVTSGYYKSQNHLNAIKNAKNLYNSRQGIVDLLIGNSRIRSEAIYKAKQNKANKKKKKIQEQDLRY